MKRLTADPGYIDAVLKHPRCNGSVQILGGSAGGYMAAWMAANGVCPGLCMSPVTDMTQQGSAQFNKLCNDYAGPNDLAVASPINHVYAGSKPVFLAAYAQDHVPASQYDGFKAALNRFGIMNQSILLAGPPGSGCSPHR